jgi:hypothetical protein
VLTVCVSVESLYGVNHFYQGILIPCQSHHGTYACTPGRYDASGGNGMNSGT